MVTSLAEAQVSRTRRMSTMVKGWLREQDENTTCPEGSLTRQKTLHENQDVLEAQEGSAQADHSSKWHP